LAGIITKGIIIEGLLKKLEIDYQEEEIHKYRASHIFEDIVADKTTLVFQYHVRGKDFDKGGEVASALKRTLKRLGIHPDIIRRAAIATYEAEMNIIIYADSGDMTVKVEPSRIFIKAEDSGPGIPDIEKAMQPGFTTAPDWVREMGFGAGMGLNNIQKCADGMVLNSTVGKGTVIEIDIGINNRK
jgi:anti-sigma regulatory factor (Ser/Thr protein kinase)